MSDVPEVYEARARREQIMARVESARTAVLDAAVAWRKASDRSPWTDVTVDLMAAVDVLEDAECRPSPGSSL